MASSWNIRQAVKKAHLLFIKIRDYFGKWKIKINSAKTELIVFSHKREIPPTITVDDEMISPSESVKYLGVHLDKKLNFTKHINITRGKALGMLSTLFNLY